MTPEDEIKRGIKIFKRMRRQRLINRLWCFFGFHATYYKYGPYRSITYNTKHPSSSNGPEHLGYHCECCDVSFGFNPRKGKRWFKFSFT